LVKAFESPKTAMNIRMAWFELSPNSDSAKAGMMLRSVPSIAPTMAFITTSNEN